ncbi:Cytochrome b5, putative [Pediculus humanus corporis]|uniref:Cytochrome b5, putative n=1 Tax=Pediculus humanus subsp. corporis TaxID=121224 RepID=E0VFQ4_PEDHC|nr:Cytochrome b5, putative [Pediculus humanus corporis]EEB12210.1 Cytochrome b5, putative [Pediculus humanus corporis]
MEEQDKSSYLGNVLQFAVSTALQFVDFKTNNNNNNNNMEKNDEEEIDDVNIKTEHLREINLDQISWHDQIDDCWVILYDRVYDVTEFLQQHPGGIDVLLEYAGRDATIAYRGFGHSSHAWKILQKYLIGVLPENERMKIFKPCEMEMNFQLKAASS